MVTVIVKYSQTQVLCGSDPNHDVIIKHVQSKEIQPCMPSEVIVSTLQYIMVAEWLSNRSEYFPFFLKEVQTENYEEEGFKYLNGATETELEHHIFLKILVTQDIHTLEIPSIEKKVFTLYKDAMLQTVRSYHCH